MTSSLVRKKGPLRRALLAWYRREARDLPWRGNRDPYTVWVAEIVLQQTRVDQGTPYIERFLGAFPTVQRLAQAKLDDVLKLWEGLGYYTRARNLHRAAGIVVNELGGAFPAAAEDWRKLPGVGRYTAGAIGSIVFGEEVPVVDGNVKRVLSRLTDLDACIDDGSVTESLWDLAGVLVKGRSPGDFNQALMELGARICTPKNPECHQCPLKKMCAACAAGTQEQRPVRRTKKPTPHHELAVAAIRKNGRYLLGKRPPKGLLGGLWEFPGGPVGAGETHESAIRREMRAQLGIAVKVGGLVASVDHAYSHFRVTLSVYLCEHRAGKPTPRAHTELKWVTPKRFSQFAFPKANHKFIQLL